MTNKIIHILNGDALKEQFPKQLKGEVIVCRTCLVDGDVKANSLEELYKVRSNYIAKSYPDFNSDEYYTKAVPEIEKIRGIKDKTEVNLWFEDDLFCQVNFWFVSHLLQELDSNLSINLVRPKLETPYAFGYMSQDELIKAFEEKTTIVSNELSDFSKIWVNYQNNEKELNLKIAQKLENKYPFLKPAIAADIERTPKNRQLSRPKQSLKTIVKDLNTTDFGVVFKEFCNREGIYGFGDLQVKRLFDELGS